MATSAAGGNLIPFPISSRAVAQPATTVSRRRSRRISPAAGRAIEMLGHAIEYLADEFALDCASGEVRMQPGRHPRLAAIELLKACNREIYLSCPEVPTLRERVRGWLRRKHATEC